MPVTINNSYVMRAWYDVTYEDLEGGKRGDERGMRASQKAIEQLIARERQRGIDARRLVLAGFSQGGAMALQTGLRHPERLAGIMALSTYLPLVETLPGEIEPANADVPIFFAHGTHDAVIPFVFAQASRSALVSLGYSVEWHEYPMEHSVCAEEVAAAGDWLRKVL
jgi:phospholipase/carboxylesterase